MEIDDYAMRAIEEADLPKLLEWRNSPEIHSKMLTDHIITWEEHLAWFNRLKIQDPPLNFAFTYKGDIAGYLGCPKYDAANKVCDVGCYLGTDVNLPVDAGVCLGTMLYRYVFLVLGVKKVITEVFVDNHRVLKLNIMGGFKVLEEHTVEADDVIRKKVKIELACSDWKRMNGM